jgi:predicted RNA-binding protein with PIN domain
MPLLIDGYNLLHASGLLGRGRGRGALESARRALLNFLANALPDDEVARTTVVFDAHEAPWGALRRSSHAGISVIFGSSELDADSVIEQLILEDSAPKRLTVVSSDHRLHRAAKRRKATPVDSDRWFQETIRARAARQQPNADVVIKPDGPFTEGEVDYWLRHFGLEENPRGKTEDPQANQAKEIEPKDVKREKNTRIDKRKP